jgi:hypothetical protein
MTNERINQGWSRWWGIVGMLWLGGMVAVAEDGATVRVLSIGNSFSRNATQWLGALSEAGGKALVHHPIIVGGASLELHALKAQRHEADAVDAAGLYTDGKSLKARLMEAPWDFVTIQQASIKSHDYGTYQPFGGWLADYVRRHAPGAKLLVHQTWAYRRDDPRFAAPPKAETEPGSREAMHAGLVAAYQKLAEAAGAGVLPVGVAFDLAERDKRWGYQPDGVFDFKLARPPALPVQTHSLHTGWRWVMVPSGQQVLRMDGHHASLVGQYLGACVWYEVLFGESCVGNGFVPEGIGLDYARFLQETAHAAVLKVKN